MDHDEVAANLAAYAAGTLDPVHVGILRAHLATGCPSCLASVFEAPVGQRRPAPEVAREAAERGSAWTIVAVLTLVAAGGLTAGLLARERQLRTRTVSEALARVREAAETAADLRDRLLMAKGVLRSLRRVADAEQAVLARGADQAAREAAMLREELREGRQQLVRLEAEVAGGRLASEALAGEGFELRALRPAVPFRSVRGHVLWRPTNGEMVVYALGLPVVPPEVDYEARVIVEPGRVFSSRLRRRPDGRAFAYLALPRDGSAVRAVEVRRVSDSRRLLIADADR